MLEDELRGLGQTALDEAFPDDMVRARTKYNDVGLQLQLMYYSPTHGGFDPDSFRSGTSCTFSPTMLADKKSVQHSIQLMIDAITRHLASKPEERANENTN